MLKILQVREKLLLALALCLSAAWILGQFFLVPLVQRAASLDESIRSLEGRLSRYAGLLKQKDLIERRYAQECPGLGDYKSVGDVSVQALAELEFLAQGSGISIQEINPVPGPKSSSSTMLIELKGTGDPRGLTRFLFHLGNSLHGFKIEKAQIARRPSGASLDLNLTLSSNKSII